MKEICPNCKSKWTKGLKCCLWCSTKKINGHFKTEFSDIKLRQDWRIPKTSAYCRGFSWQLKIGLS